MTNIKKLISSVFVASLMAANAQAGTIISKEVKITPMQVRASTRDEFKDSLKYYFDQNSKCSDFDECVSEHKIDELSEQLVQTESGLRERLDTAANSKFVYHEEAFPKLSTITFNSLINRDGHPSDQVHGFIYRPVMMSDCVKKPATILIHHIQDNIKSEQFIAHLATGFTNNVVMLIYLPKFGPRRLNNEAFLAGSTAEVIQNAFQSVLDIHVARDILRSQPDVDPEKISLFGISLGGIVTHMSAGIDPGFSKYGTLVGGGDIAAITAKRATEDPSSETGRALSHIKWTDNVKAREELVMIEPIVWAHRLKNSKVVSLSAKDDELIDLTNGVEKLLNIYKSNNNKVDLRVHKGEHNPTQLSIKELLAKIFKPVFQFITEEESSVIRSCAQ